MKNDLVPTNDHIARYCAPTFIDNGIIQAAAFILKKNEQNLSVNWLENIHPANRTEQLRNLRNIYKNKKLNNPKGKIAVLNCGEVCNKVKSETDDKREIKVVHEPSPNDKSHSEMHNLNPNNEFIAELILEVIHEEYPAKT